MKQNDYDIKKIIEEAKGENKKKSYTFKVHEVVIMVFFTCILSFFIGSSIMELKMNEKNKKEDTELKIQDEHLNEFIKNYEFIINNYYKDVDEDKLIKGAIEGMMSVLDDPYSIYMLDDEYNSLNISLDGSYKGLGVEITQTEDGYLGVMRVFDGSPADLAGIKSGDIILKIDDKDTKGISASEFSKTVLNGTKNDYILKIRRANEEMDIEVSKNDISLKSVSSRVIENGDKKIGYIYVSIFAINTYGQFKEQLEKLENNKIDALIIDLRSNTGGHLSSAESISSLFVDKKHVIYQISQAGKTTKVKSSGKETKKYQIVFLADNYSASASELLIMCLKENLDAKVVGLNTYGKGTVQELIGLSSGDRYKITTKKWLSPKGNWINEVGIKPDVEVKLNSEYYLNPSEENDNQLKTAIDYIMNNILK